MSNVLLNLNEVPQFEQLKANEIEDNLNELIRSAKKVIADIKKNTIINWETIVIPITEKIEKVKRAWGVVAHINSVCNTEEWRDAYNKMTPIVSDFYTEISQDLELFQLFKKIQNDAENNLTEEQLQRLKHEIRDFELSGASLPENERRQFAKTNSELSILSNQFSQNVLDSTDSFALYFEDEKELSGISESDLALFKFEAKREGKQGYKVGLQYPYYLSIMKFSENRELRRKMHYAYFTRASELFAQGMWDNTLMINEILLKNDIQAKLLNYKSYADVSLATKMADSPLQVIQFITDIVSKAKFFALQEMKELKEFAYKELALDELKPWDLTFASEKLRQAKYAFSETEVKNYFEVKQVFNGLFFLINELYGVKFVEENRPVWHPEVRFYSLLKDGQKIGGVYVDLYARQGKKGGAWMDEYCGRWKKQYGIQLPIAYLITNFTPAQNQIATYLSHQEIITLFHEMGHCLHHLLTEVNELGISGISGVEWDAVELPSQFMENFAWEFDVLQMMSKHKITGEPLPKSLFDKMRQAKNFQIGLFLLRQMEFALFDMRIYSETDQPCDWNQIIREVREEVAVVPQVDYNRFANSFEHIFAGGYSAGYYSYIWAEVLSADVYEAFIESEDRKQTGAKFLKEVLAKGSSRSALESFIAFRGRKPEIEPLLKHLGLFN